MPRRPTGTVVWCPPVDGEKRGHYKARITYKDGARPWIHFDPGPRSSLAEARAREKAAAWSERARSEGTMPPADVRERIAKAGGKRTFSQFAASWIAERKARGLTSAATDEKYLAKHVDPHLGRLPIVDVSKTDLIRLVEHLDGRVRAGDMRWKTAINIFGTVTKMFSDACESKRLDLRVRSDNPAEGVRGPDRGDERGGPYLFPNEASALLGCSEVSVHDRALYAMGLYTGLRLGELAALRTEHVSLDGGYVVVSKSRNGTTGADKGTKGRRTRKVPIEPSVRPLVEALIKRPLGRDGRLFAVPNRAMADAVRRHATRAGLTRPELFANDDQSMPVRFHSMRHTYATWLALAGCDAMVIQQRGGWTDLALVNRYVEEAESIGRGDVGKPFPPVPASLVAAVLESSRESSRASSKGPRKPLFQRKNRVGAVGIEPTTSTV